MSTVYSFLRCSKGAVYLDHQIKDYSYLRLKPKIDKPAGALAGLSRVHGHAAPEVQDRIIDILIEICVRYELSYREIAHVLLICKIESGFNPDAAAGTTSASGLGQYTKDAVEEAAKSHVSKKRLKFTLDLSGDRRFDAQLGAYGVLLSYMFCKEKAVAWFGKDYEKYLYLFHHESWYLKPTPAVLEKAKVKAVLKIIEKDITPNLGPLEKLLAAKSSLAFELKTKDQKPYANKPYLAIVPSASKKSASPAAIQGAGSAKPEIIIGRTDALGKTESLMAPGLSEIVFVVLNDDYKDLLNVSSNDSLTHYKVRRGDTLARIAEDNRMTLEEVQRVNNISNPNKIREGQELTLYRGDYLWRRPPANLIAQCMREKMNINPAAVEAIVEHKRSHIMLPKGNVAQKNKQGESVVTLVAGASEKQVAAKKKAKEIPHKTVSEKITQEVKIAAPAPSASPQRLLFPLPIRPTATYNEHGRRFGASRDGGRRHAGCDLYAPLGTVVRAMADGIVTRCAHFYWETDAIEVNHGTFTIRYSEVAKRTPAQRAALIGTAVKRGQALGTIGRLIRPNGVPFNHTMLHLEAYSGVGGGPLSDTTRLPYMRRADLIDPTDMLDNCAME